MLHYFSITVLTAEKLILLCKKIQKWMSLLHKKTRTVGLVPSHSDTALKSQWVPAHALMEVLCHVEEISILQVCSQRSCHSDTCTRSFQTWWSQVCYSSSFLLGTGSNASACLSPASGVTDILIAGDGHSQVDKVRKDDSIAWAQWSPLYLQGMFSKTPWDAWSCIPHGIYWSLCISCFFQCLLTYDKV
jgi:hypothetical protein